MNSTRTALADQQVCFQAQVEIHKRIIYKVVSGFAWQQEDQQDLAQEITVQLWRSFPKYDPKRPFSTWMYQVSLNTAISWSRKSKLLGQHLTTSEDITQIPDNQPDSSDSQTLYHLIESLDELSRALLLLYIDERSHTEIGEILGITATNVAVKLNRLKARLRMEVEQQN